VPEAARRPASGDQGCNSGDLQRERAGRTGGGLPWRADREPTPSTVRSLRAGFDSATAHG